MRLVSCFWAAGESALTANPGSILVCPCCLALISPATSAREHSDPIAPIPRAFGLIPADVRRNTTHEKGYQAHYAIFALYAPFSSPP